MSQPPTPYTRAFDFTDFSAMQPSAQQPGQKIDQELNLSLTSTNQTISRLNEIQRDDGKLRTSALDLTELTTIAVPPGGTTGQVLAKTSNVSYQTAWSTLGTMSMQTAANYSTTAVANGLYYPLSGNPSGFLTSVPVTSVAGRTGAIVLANTDISGLGTLSVVNDAPSNGTQYARKNGAWDAVSTAPDYITSVTAPLDVTTGNLTVDLSTYRLLTAYDFTNVADTKLTGFGMTLNPPVGTTSSYDSYVNADLLYLKQDDSGNGTQPGSRNSLNASSSGFLVLNQTWEDDGSGGVTTDGGKGFLLTPLTGLRFTNGSGASASGTIIYNRTGITFGDATVQTIAFPGFNNVALTGTPTAPTAALADNDTSIATTAFVQQELASGTANARNLEVYVRNQTGSTIPIGSIVYINGATGNRPTITKAQANNDTNSAQTIGFTKTAIANNGFGFVIVRGELENLNTNSLTEGVQLYLSPTTAGAYTITKPSAPQHLVYVGIVIRAHPTQGVILVSVQNGYELSELHDVALASEANLDLLTYESSTDLWKNKSFATLGLAPLASPTFSGTPSLPTGTTGITQTAGNNTTALATTAFVTAAVPAFATNEQALTSTSTTTALSPFNSRFSDLAPFVYAPVPTSMTSVTTAGSSTMTSYGGSIGSSSSAAGYVLRAAQPYSRGVTVTAGIQWQKPQMFAVRLVPFYAFQTASIFRMTLGSNTATLNVLANRGIGIRFGASATNVLSALVLDVHNGTTLTSVTSSFTPTLAQGFDLMVYSDGAGNVTLYANDVQVATTSAGPSVGGASTYNLLQLGIENTATITTGSNVAFSSLKTFIS